MSIPTRVILKILWRSFFIQGAWNFKGMQNIGFTHAILPGFTFFNREKLQQAIKRSIPFFNTQPYMAPTAIGVFLNLHEQGNEELMEKIRPSLTGSLAAIGDTFFWAALKPILGLVLVISALMDQLWGSFLALILYNAIHVWTMAWGLLQGYLHGPQGAIRLGQMLSVNLTKYISLVIPFLSGVVLGLVPQWTGGRYDLIVGFLVFLASTILIKLRVNIFWIVYGVFTLSMVWTMLQ